MKSSLCILLIFSLLLIGHVSSSYDKISHSLFVNRFLDSKKGDIVKGLDIVRQYFVKYGYLHPSAVDRYQTKKGDDDSEILDNALEEAIKKFQVFYNLDVSGVLDEKTLSQMVKPRCGFPDLVNGTTIKHGMKLVRHPISRSYYVLGNTKWSKFNLTWALRPGTRKGAFSPIDLALKRWASVSPFHFKNIKDFDKADVKIAFFRGAHGDASPFDGPGKVLAHAAMPTYGFLHFDADENWVNGASPGGIDIGSVGLHELGHVLGLAHSQDESSIMWPSMPSGMTKDLGADDIRGIKALYNFPWL